MDKWSEDQIKKMQYGGNKKCLDFFKAHSGEYSLLSKFFKKDISTSVPSLCYSSKYHPSRLETRNDDPGKI